VVVGVVLVAIAFAFVSMIYKIIVEKEKHLKIVSIINIYVYA